ncbi:MAG: OmpP1/FadL family transporter [Vibrio sp.]
MTVKRKVYLSGVTWFLYSASSFGAGYEFAKFNYTHLYSKENKITLAYTRFHYNVDGRSPDGKSTGNVMDDLDYLQGGFNYHFNDKFSANLQFYRAHNLDTEHTKGMYQGSGAYLKTQVIALTGLYHFTPNVSFFAGPTFNKTEIIVNFDNALTRYNGRVRSDFGTDWGYGYTMGASYEIPEMGLRATLGYQSEVKFHFDNMKETGPIVNRRYHADSVTSSTEITMPRSITFDFQTAIAPKTFLLANVHWRDWSSHQMETKVTKDLTKESFVTFAHDTFDYGLGFAHQLTPKLILFTEGVYGEGAGDSGVVNPLAPGNGSTTVKLGGRYAIGDFSLFLVGGYIWLKDGTAKVGGTKFKDNTVTTLSTGFEYRF